MPFRIRLAVLLSMFVSVLVPISATAQPSSEENVEVIGSMWCDTLAQLETLLLAHFKDNVPIGRALAQINRDKPDACIWARAIVSLGPEIRRQTAGNSLVSLRSAKVLGVMQGQYAVMMRPQTWFGVRVVAELMPL